MRQIDINSDNLARQQPDVRSRPSIKPPSDDGFLRGGILEAEYGALPDTVRARTGGGGLHLLFRHPGGTQAIPNAVGLRPGIDIRGDGGYLVVPPSRHASGREYEWERAPEDTELAPLPAWLARLVTQPGSRDRAGDVASPQWITEALRGVVEGQRDDPCTRLAGYLLGHQIPADIVTVILTDTFGRRCEPPFPPADVEKCVQSIARREPVPAPAVEAIDAVDLLKTRFEPYSWW
jgi:hypothetical protein